jgi:hypothetical protein
MFRSVFVLVSVLVLSGNARAQVIGDPATIGSQVAQTERTIAKILAYRNPFDFNKTQWIKFHLDGLKSRLTDKKFRWWAFVAKSVSQGEKAVTVVVPSCFLGATPIRVNYDGSGTRDAFVIRVPASGDSFKQIKLGDKVYLEGVIIDVTSIGKSAKLIVGSLAVNGKKPLKRDEKDDDSFKKPQR